MITGAIVHKFLPKSKKKHKKKIFWIMLGISLLFALVMFIIDLKMPLELTAFWISDQLLGGIKQTLIAGAEVAEKL